ncbi:MAG: hypothetical protein WDW38_002894 [Sanguina aurantia]
MAPPAINAPFSSFVEGVITELEAGVEALKNAAAQTSGFLDTGASKEKILLITQQVADDGSRMVVLCGDEPSISDTEAVRGVINALRQSALGLCAISLDFVCTAGSNLKKEVCAASQSVIAASISLIKSLVRELLDGDVEEEDDESQVEYNGAPATGAPPTGSSQPTLPAAYLPQPAPNIGRASHDSTSTTCSATAVATAVDSETAPSAEGVDALTEQLQGSGIRVQPPSSQGVSPLFVPLQSVLSLTHLHQSECSKAAAEGDATDGDGGDAESDEADMFGFDTTPLTEAERAVSLAAKVVVEIVVRALKHVSKLLVQGPSLELGSLELGAWENALFHVSYVSRAVENLGAAQYGPQDPQEVRECGESLADTLEQLLEEVPESDTAATDLIVEVLQSELSIARLQLQLALDAEAE